MNRGIGLGIAALAIAVVAYLVVKPGAPKPAAPTAPAGPREPAAAPPAGPDAAATKAPDASPPGAEPAPGDEDPIRATFVEVYCAQQKGETQKLTDIYQAKGFEDPKAWTEAWTKASQDKAWVARALLDAQARCP